MIGPYKSKYYESTYYYERFGNYIVYPGIEIYLYIVDYIVPGIEPYRYSISNRMRVYDYKKQEFVRISDKTTYPTVNLYNVSKGAVVTSLLHRLYMLAFCYFPGCENYEVNHIDGNKFNCTPSNLEWMTHKENMNHAFEYIMTNDRKLSNQDIVELIEMYNNGEKIKDIADKFDISTGYVIDIVKGKRSSTKLDLIKKDHPVTREKVPPKLSKEDMTTIIKRYNDGEEYFELANEYGVDRSGLAKAIKRYAKNHPGEVILRSLKTFTPEMAEVACRFIQDNPCLDISSLYTLCLEEIGLENTVSNRKAIKNLYHGKTYKNISSKYNFDKSSTTIEKVAE